MAGTREERSQQVRQRLMDSTIQLFNRVGADVTTEAICQEAGVGKGTLFNYFKNKENLLHETFLHCHYHAVEMTDEGVNYDASVDVAVKQRLRNAARWAVQFPQEVLYTGNYNRASQADLFTVDDRRGLSGIIDDPRIFPRLSRMMPEGFPRDFLSVAIANLNYQFCLYLVCHPEYQKDQAGLERIVDWIWNCIESARFLT